MELNMRVKKGHHESVDSWKEGAFKVRVHKGQSRCSLAMQKSLLLRRHHTDYLKNNVINAHKTRLWSQDTAELVREFSMLPILRKMDTRVKPAHNILMAICVFVCVLYV